MEQEDGLPSPVGPFGRLISSAQLTPREFEEDNVPAPTHNEERCEICQLHLQHLSIHKSHYPDVPTYDSLGAAPITTPAQSFEDGVMLGLRLQKESDDALLNQYRKRLLRAEAQRDISRRWQYDVERLERELAETRDMLLAVQISYEETVDAHTNIDTEFDAPGEVAGDDAHVHADNNNDSASQLTLDGAEAASVRSKGTVLHNQAGHAGARPDSLHASTDTPVDFKDEEDDDLFVWEQLRALEEGDQQEFWKAVYNIEDRNSPDHQPLNLQSTNNNDDHLPASAVGMQVNTHALDGRSPSPRHSDKGTGDDDYHSDGEESSYSFI